MSEEHAREMTAHPCVWAGTTAMFISKQNTFESLTPFLCLYTLLFNSLSDLKSSSRLCRVTRTSRLAIGTRDRIADLIHGAQIKQPRAEFAALWAADAPREG